MEFILTLQYINTVAYIKAYAYYTKIPSKQVLEVQLTLEKNNLLAPLSFLHNTDFFSNKSTKERIPQLKVTFMKTIKMNKKIQSLLPEKDWWHISLLPKRPDIEKKIIRLIDKCQSLTAVTTGLDFICLQDQPCPDLEPWCLMANGDVEP